ncbi:MAG TPA: hypothetical protein DCG28_03570 [Lachnospiraceae bacterium]|nr:hypothetical protein [Lachnospiraceae bacterium]
MELKRNECPYCGAKIQFPEEGDFFCEYCDGAISLPKKEVPNPPAAPPPPTPAMYERNCPTCNGSIYFNSLTPGTTTKCTHCGEYVTITRKEETAPPKEQTPQKPAPPKFSPKSYSTTLFLCIFLGWFGFHRFYVGKTISGLLYLFTVGGFGYGNIIDIFLILSKKFTDADGLLVCQN